MLRTEFKITYRIKGKFNNILCDWRYSAPKTHHFICDGIGILYPTYFKKYPNHQIIKVETIWNWTENYARPYRQNGRAKQPWEYN